MCAPQDMSKQDSVSTGRRLH